MFEKSTIQIEVSIRSIDGAIIRGTLSTGQSGSLESVLSKETPFLEFLSRDGQRKFLAKRQIAYVEPVEPLKKPRLNKSSDPRYTDAHSLLGVKRGCSIEEAKIAFHQKAKQYHPDKFSGIELPTEISHYVNDMFRQINTAFTEIRSELNAAA